MGNKKIILIYDFLSEFGGVERVMSCHKKWLEEAGHNVTLLFSHVDKKTADYFHKNSKVEEISKFKGSETFKLFTSLFGFNTLKNYDADLVISYSFPSLYMARKMKCKQAFYYLPMEFIYYPIKKRWEWANDLKRKVAFFASFIASPILKILDKKWIKDKLILANSEFTRKEIKERYNVNSVVCYPPLNEKFIRNNKNIHKRFIMTAGRIVPDKRTDWLIESFAKLKDKHLLFLIVGQIEDSYKKELEELSKKLGVNDRVRFTGVRNQDELIELYSEAQCFIFASPEEAFGLSPIEAIRCGCPAVAWGDGGGTNEYIKPLINGYLAKPYDLDDFKFCIEGAISISNKEMIINSVNQFTENEQKRLFLEAIRWNSG